MEHTMENSSNITMMVVVYNVSGRREKGMVKGDSTTAMELLDFKQNMRMVC